MFQNALSGKEQIAIIVNVNPSPDLYVETENVLNLASIANKIAIESKKIKRKTNSSRFSVIVDQTQNTTTDWDKRTDVFNIVKHSVSADHPLRMAITMKKMRMIEYRIHQKTTSISRRRG